MRRLTIVGVFVLVAIVSVLDPVEAKGSDCENQAVGSILQPVTGTARFCLNHRGVKGRMWLQGLTPDEAYTVWWVYIDDPLACETPGICGDVDFAGPDPLVVFGLMDSLVANSHGRTQIEDFLRGMEPTEGSQFWMLMLGHDQAKSGKALARQLLTPEDPAAGTPHLGNIVDGALFEPAAIAVFNVD